MHTPTPNDASRMQYILVNTLTQLQTYSNTSRIRCTPTYHNASRTKCTPHTPTPNDASRMHYTHNTPTQLYKHTITHNTSLAAPDAHQHTTYHNASRTRRTPPTPDETSRMQYRHKTCATSHQPWPWPQSICIYILWAMGPGAGLVAHVLWRYCMRLASSGVGGVRRVRLALLYVGSCVGVLWMMFWMRLSSSGVWGGCIGHRVPSEG